jgi:hypothetical protein
MIGFRPSKLGLALCAAMLGATPAVADRFRAENRFYVADLGGGVFEAIARGGSSAARDFWCAAGDYALKRLRAGGSTRVYLVSGIQPSVTEPGRKAVRFTLTPEAAGVAPITPPLSLSVDIPGDNMPVVLAKSYCQKSISRF